AWRSAPLFRRLPSDVPWRWCCRSSGCRLDRPSPARQTVAAKSRAAPNDESDCRSSSADHRPKTVLPATPHFEHLDDAADDPAVVLAMHPRLVLRQLRFDCRPLPIVEPKFPRHDPSPRSFLLESRLLPDVN